MEKHEHTKHEDSGYKHMAHRESKTKIKKVRIWQVSTAVLGVLLIISIFMGGFSKGSANGSALSGNAVADKAVKFINENLMQGRGTATLEGVEESNGMYKIKLDIDGQEMESFISNDGKLLFPQAVDLTNKPQLQQPPTQAQDVNINIENSASKGADDAKVVMVEYSSFSCGYCNKVRGTIDQILSEYPNDVKVVYKHFNRGGTDSETAQAAECAGEQDKFWEMHDLIFDKGSQGDPIEYAQEIGINTDKFSECLDSGKYSAKVTADTNEARSFGISGTPSFMINGKLVKGAQPYENFKKIIDEELGLKPKTTTPQASTGYTDADLTKIAEFSECLAKKGVKIYGANWCGWTKKFVVTTLGGFDTVSPIYVECTENQEECSTAGITGYPTTQINGEPYSGERTIEGLASATGCVAPELEGSVQTADTGNVAGCGA
jgi:protein-disulfide isomerase